MGYRVRSPDGELNFKHFADIAEAYRNGLVGPDDEIIEDGKETGVKARTHNALGEPPAPKTSLTASQPMRVAVAVVLAIAAMLAWRADAWGLYVRAPLVLIIAIAMALLLSKAVQEAAHRPRR